MADDDFPLQQRDCTDGPWQFLARSGTPANRRQNRTRPPGHRCSVRASQRIDAALGRAPTTMASRKPRESDNEDGWLATKSLSSPDGNGRCVWALRSPLCLSWFGQQLESTTHLKLNSILCPDSDGVYSVSGSLTADSKHDRSRGWCWCSCQSATRPRRVTSTSLCSCIVHLLARSPGLQPIFVTLRLCDFVRDNHFAQSVSLTQTHALDRPFVRPVPSTPRPYPSPMSSLACSNDPWPPLPRPSPHTEKVAMNPLR